VVVTLGYTVCEPDAETPPIYWSIETEVAPTTSHDRVVGSPLSIDVSDASKLTISGKLVVDTETVTDLVVEPKLLLAVSVYVVVAVGLTVFVPDAETLPTLWLIESEVAPLTVHVSVDVPPLVIVLGLAVKLVISGKSPSTVTVTVSVTEP
jgi:hypothetical protein